MNPIEQIIIDAVNAARRCDDLEPLELDGHLAQIAAAHSKDMVNRNYFHHINPDGEDPTQRAIRYGYQLFKPGLYDIDEVIARVMVGSHGQIGEITNDPDDIASECMLMWLDHGPHEDIISEWSATKIGVGVARKENWHYITVNFY